MSMDAVKNKAAYTAYADKIFDKRYNSPNVLRRYVHRAQYASILSHIKAGETVGDIGCGEGVLSCLLAEQGNKVVGIDISEPNIERARALAKEMGVEDRVTFMVGDAEQVPCPDGNFDVVVSCHVLEHLPSFDKGLSEVYRLTKGRAVIALPTICNLCSLIQAGGGSFWEFSPRSLWALLKGFLLALVHLSGEGVDEGYGGHKELTHIWRYPWVIRRRIRSAEFTITSLEPSTICLPFFSFFIPLIQLLDRCKRWPVLRSCGYGTTVIAKK